MKPEIYKFWEEALSCLENAEKLLKDKRFQEAENNADCAIMYGCATIVQLAKELGMPNLLVIKGNEYIGWLERGENTILPRKLLNGLERLLKDYLMNYHQTH
jgi:hypothetical protein